MNNSGLSKTLLNKYIIEFIPTWYLGTFVKVSNVSNIPIFIVFILSSLSCCFSILNSDLTSKFILLFPSSNIKLSYEVFSINEIESLIIKELSE